MLEFRQVTKSYAQTGAFWKSARKRVLDGVSFRVHEGACAGLVGISGCGKSTLARLALGLEAPDSGDVHMEGMPLALWRQKHPHAMSVVFQEYSRSANPQYTIRQVLEEPFAIAGRGREAVKAIPELLERMRLQPALLDRYPYELSGGQMQRVCIARAVSLKPRFLVLDEPLSSLDAPVQSEVLALLKGITSHIAGTTCLFISHDLEAARQLSDKLLFMQNGKIVEECTVADVESLQSEYARALMNASKSCYTNS